MHYRIFVPPSYRRDGPPLPLIVIPPTGVRTSRPFLESPFVADHYSAVKLAQIAARLKVGLLWLGYRSNISGAPIDFAHIDEVFEEVSGLYHLDSRRTTLWAVSTAGIVGSMEILRHPRRYAGAAMLDAALHRTSHRRDGRPDFQSLEAYRRFLEQTDPFLPLARLSGMPLWLKNNATDSDHVVLIDEERDFVEQARKAGTRPLPVFTRIPGEDSADLKMMIWLAAQSRDDPDPGLTVDFPPLSAASVLAERFIVVASTAGTSEGKAANRGLCDAFRESWKRVNYVTCRVLDDAAVTEQDERESNLVLIGNERTNRLWARLAGALPVKLDVEAVVASGRTWSGRNLSVQVRCPHPRFPARKILLMGSANPLQTGFGTFELSLDGWFDCAVWQRVGGEAVLLDAIQVPPQASAGGADRPNGSSGPGRDGPSAAR